MQQDALRQSTEQMRAAQDALRQRTEWQQMHEDALRQTAEWQRMQEDAVRQFTEPLRAEIRQFTESLRVAQGVGRQATGLGAPHTDLLRPYVSVVALLRPRQANDSSLIASQIPSVCDVAVCASTNFYESANGLWLPSQPLPSATEQLAAAHAWQRSYASPPRRAPRNAYISRARVISHWFVLRGSVIFHTHIRSLLAAPNALRMRWRPSIKHADMPAFSPSLA
jgi:hypothetical protein